MLLPSPPGPPASPSQEDELAPPIEDVASDSQRSGLSAFFVFLIIGVSCLLIWLVFSPSGAHAAWYDSIDKGTIQAELTRKPMLVFYTADWCPPCKMLKKQTFADDQVAKYLADNYILIKIDLTDRQSPNQAIAREYEVNSIPTMFIYTSLGIEIDSINGFIPPREFLEWIRK